MALSLWICNESGHVEGLNHVNNARQYHLDTPATFRRVKRRSMSVSKELLGDTHLLTFSSQQPAWLLSW
jgi:hypothetical protein